MPEPLSRGAAWMSLAAYDDLLLNDETVKKLRENSHRIEREWTAHENTARPTITKAYNLLRSAGLSILDSRDRVEGDYGNQNPKTGIWQLATIRKVLPDECKAVEKTSGKTKKEILALAGGGDENIDSEEESFTDPEKVQIMIKSRDQEIESWKNRAKANEAALNETLCNIKETPLFKEQADELERARTTIAQLSAVKEGGFITADKVKTEHEVRIDIQEYFNKLRAYFVNREKWVHLVVNGLGDVTEIYGEKERE